MGNILFPSNGEPSLSPMFAPYIDHTTQFPIVNISFPGENMTISLNMSAIEGNMTNVTNVTDMLLNESTIPPSLAPSMSETASTNIPPSGPPPTDTVPPPSMAPVPPPPPDPAPTDPLPTPTPLPPPTPQPTTRRTRAPSVAPVPQPVTALTESPTFVPTNPNPTLLPTALPTILPTALPTPLPTVSPTPLPTSAPSEAPITISPTQGALILTQQGSFRLLETVPHDPGAFTQGLVFHPNGTLYESTGLFGQSSVRSVDLLTGVVWEQHDLEPIFFGEGLAHDPVNDRLIQLTWRSGTAFVYDAATLDVLSDFSFTSTRDEGWGIAYSTQLKGYYMTDGSSYIHTWAETDFAEVNRIRVYTQSASTSVNSGVEYINQLNEIEWDPTSNTILANVWLTDVIVRIDPTTGLVKTRFDLSSLNRPSSANVLNGIAFTPGAKDDEVWVTGKLWPNMYRIQLIEEE